MLVLHRLGITSGIIEVTMMQSFNYCKNARQQGLPLSMDPRVRGNSLAPRPRHAQRLRSLALTVAWFPQM